MLGYRNYIFLGFLFLLGSNANAQTTQWPSLQQMVEDGTLVLISDYDNTLTGKAWNSMWRVERIPFVKNIWQTATNTNNGSLEFDKLPMDVNITEREFFESYQNKLAIQEDGGSYNVRTREVVTLPALGLPGREKPITFLPGYYTVTSRSFVYFRSNPDANFLVLDDALAKVESERTGLSRFGLTFNLFQWLASTKKGISNIHIVTARGQSFQEFYTLFRNWLREGWISNIYGSSHRSYQGRNVEHMEIHAMGRGEAILYGTHLSEQKVRVVDEKILTHYRLKATQEQRRHYIIVADDNPELIEAYHKLFKHLSAISNYKDYMDFMLVHTGSDAEVLGSSPGRRYSIYENGFVVAASEKLVKSLFPKSPAVKMAERADILSATYPARSGRTCMQLFAGGK